MRFASFPLLATFAPGRLGVRLRQRYKLGASPTWKINRNPHLTDSYVHEWLDSKAAGRSVPVGCAAEVAALIAGQQGPPRERRTTAVMPAQAGIQ